MNFETLKGKILAVFNKEVGAGHQQPKPALQRKEPTIRSIVSQEDRTDPLSRDEPIVSQEEIAFILRQEGLGYHELDEADLTRLVSGEEVSIGGVVIKLAPAIVKEIAAKNAQASNQNNEPAQTVVTPHSKLSPNA